MQIKQFAGESIDAVLEQVRSELGDDAMIIQTKRVVRGGIGGFFGREGIEVTAASGLSRAESEAANLEAAASVAAPALPPATAGGDEQDDPFVPAFSRALEARLAAALEAEADVPAPAAPPASPVATYARTSAPAAPFAPGDRERSEAIVAAARAALQEAHTRAAIAPAAPAGDPVQAMAAPAPLLEPAPPPVARAPRPAPTRSAGAGLEGIRSELLDAGIDARYLDPILEGFTTMVAPFLDPSALPRAALREHLAQRLPTVREWRPPSAGHTIAFVGQSGVGKTSAAVGLAGRMRAAGMPVALVAAGAGPQDALEAHARRLDVQLFRAAEGAALATLVATLADRAAVIIDTGGRSHQNLDEIEELSALLAPARPAEVHLVMPVATPLADLGDAQRRFRLVGVNRITLTKLDETRHHGNLVNVPIRMGKALGYLRDSTDPVAGVRPADAAQIAGLLLP